MAKKRKRERLQIYWDRWEKFPDMPEMPEGYVLRGFREGDEEAFARVMRASGFKGWNEETVRTEVLDNPLGAEAISLVEFEGKLVGTVSLLGREPRSDGRTWVQGSWLAIDPAHRGKSISNVYAIMVMNKMKELDIDRIEIRTDDWRLPAIGLYMRYDAYSVEDTFMMKVRWRQVKRMLINRESRIHTIDEKKMKRPMREALFWEAVCPLPIFPINLRRRRLLERILAINGDRACPLCGAKRPRLAYLKRRYTVLECRSCGIAYVADPPAKERLLELFTVALDKEKGGRAVEDYRANENSSRAEARVFLDLIESSGQLTSSDDETKRLLDVGCGPGFLIAEAKAAGWRVRGIDISPSAIEFANDELGLKEVTRESLEDAGLEPESFDLVVLRGLLEHVLDPLDYLKRSVALLKAGGIVALTASNWDSWAAQWRRRDWASMTPPRHLFSFSEAALVQQLDALGMTILSRRTNDRFLSSWPWSSGPIRRLVRRLHRGEELTIIARKGGDARQ